MGRSGLTHLGIIRKRLLESESIDYPYDKQWCLSDALKYWTWGVRTLRAERDVQRNCFRIDPSGQPTLFHTVYCLVPLLYSVLKGLVPSGLLGRGGKALPPSRVERGTPLSAQMFNRIISFVPVSAPEFDV